MTIDQVTPADLFGTTAPQGDFQAGLWALVDTFPDTTLSSTFSWSTSRARRTATPASTSTASTSRVSTTCSARSTARSTRYARIAASHEGDALIAENVPSLPLDTVPNVLLWSETVGGPLQINPVEGRFWNLAEWGLAG
ncbi:hypothetical protein ACU8V6_00470 [Vibrio alginolyticus]